MKKAIMIIAAAVVAVGSAVAVYIFRSDSYHGRRVFR